MNSEFYNSLTLYEQNRDPILFEYIIQLSNNADTPEGKPHPLLKYISQDIDRYFHYIKPKDDSKVPFLESFLRYSPIDIVSFLFY